MDAIEELRAFEALKRLKAMYFYYVDMRDGDGWVSLWAPDSTFQWETEVSAGGQDGKPMEKFTGPAGIRKIFDEMLAPSVSVHHGHMPILDLLSETEAKGIWAMEDIVTFPKGKIHGWGHYHETYRKIDGVWKFQTVYLKRLRLEITTV
jgi:hypothetical protein